MDIYDAALKRLRADTRPMAELRRYIPLPFTTLRDIKNGLTKDPRLSSAREIAKHYFPKQVF